MAKGGVSRSLAFRPHRAGAYVQGASGGHTRSPTRTTGLADRLALWRRWASLDWEGGDSCRQREVARMTTGWSCPASSSHWASCRFMAMASAAKDVRSLAQLFLCRTKGVGRVFSGAHPCTQGCCRTWAALSLCLASRTSSLEMRSLAAKEMWDQSLSGNSYFPSWMLSNSMFWQAGQASPRSQPQSLPQWPTKGG